MGQDPHLQKVGGGGGLDPPPYHLNPARSADLQVIYTEGVGLGLDTPWGCTGPKGTKICLGGGANTGAAQTKAEASFGCSLSGIPPNGLSRKNSFFLVFDFFAT